MPKTDSLDCITLRSATYDDREDLLRWRNDPDTRRYSHNEQRVRFEDHCQWLRSSLQNPNRQIKIALLGQRPVGTVRADRLDASATLNSQNSTVWLLSWTVNPEFRGQGIAKKMVQCFAEKFDSELRAEIRIGNLASVKIAQHIGMKPINQVDDFVHYRRERASKDKD